MLTRKSKFHSRDDMARKLLAYLFSPIEKTPKANERMTRHFLELAWHMGASQGLQDTREIYTRVFNRLNKRKERTSNHKRK